MVSTERITSLISKNAFLRVTEVAHLCAGGETAILRSHSAAVERFFTLKSNGFEGREVGVMGLLQRTRERAGALLGAPAADIAFLSSASEGLGQLAAGLDWQPGDNVVVEDIEFPSGLYPWTRLAEQGVEVRVVRQSGGEASFDGLAAALDDRTRVLATSQVSYLTGRRYDLADLRALADRHGALLSIDATHAAGVVPVAAHYADLLVSSCYKFLLGVHGAAIFYCNPQRLGQFQPQSLGWHSVASHHTVAAPTDYTLGPTAARFEAGNPPFMALAVLENALATLETIGVEQIERHVLALGTVLRAALQERGLTLLTPEDPARRGPNICFSWPDSVGLTAALAEHGVLVWGGDGRVRISFHAYNDEDDVTRLLAALDACLDAENKRA
jgi:cysteine desulfurase/selenocysteine lyase